MIWYYLFIYLQCLAIKPINEIPSLASIQFYVQPLLLQSVSLILKLILLIHTILLY